MKILHTADWHLDTPFTGVTQDQREALRREQLRLPQRIAEIVRREDCDLVLIAGDIFDGAYTADSLEAVRSALARMTVPVFISPGNHDFCAPDSPWHRERWPENVHIFTGSMGSVSLPELNCRIYGAGYTSMDCAALLEGFRAQGPEQHHIAVIHGDPGSASSPYNPITTAQVRASGLTYLALGHIHKAGQFTAGDTLCAWPGCPMGRGYDETGEKGLYLYRTDTRELRFLPLEGTKFYDLEVSTGSDAAAALEETLPAAFCADFYRVTLTGSGTGELPELYAQFGNLPNLTLRDHREAPVDLWAHAGEDTLEGVYFQMLHDALTDADETARRRILLAAEISRKLLDGKEVAL